MTRFDLCSINSNFLQLLGAKMIGRGDSGRRMTQQYVIMAVVQIRVDSGLNNRNIDRERIHFGGIQIKQVMVKLC